MVGAAWHGSTTPDGVTFSERRAPAAHAGLWAPGVVIGHHRIDHQPAGVARPAMASMSCQRAVDLLPRRHQRGTVAQGPAVILRVGDLDAPGAQRGREIDQFAHPSDVGAVDDGVDRQRHVQAGDSLGEAQLAGVSAVVASDAVGGDGVGILDRQLDVVQAGGLQLRQPARSSPIAEVIRLV